MRHFSSAELLADGTPVQQQQVVGEAAVSYDTRVGGLPQPHGSPGRRYTLTVSRIPDETGVDTAVDVSDDRSPSQIPGLGGVA